jgi:D-beta-D-heptose 7-phosphate kinase/D-beta-D-heptose 1-phosphate adenosyltransferase
MKRTAASKIVTENIAQAVREMAGENGTVSFCNGAWGLVHPGHAHYLEDASRYASILVVAVNSDETYEILKGRKPPAIWAHRALLLASLESVDVVVTLDEMTPHALIRAIRPDFLIKSDSSELPPVGHDVVESYGGQVVVLKAFGGYSTTNLLGLDRQIDRYQPTQFHDPFVQHPDVL